MLVNFFQAFTLSFQLLTSGILARKLGSKATRGEEQEAVVKTSGTNPVD